MALEKRVIKEIQDVEGNPFVNLIFDGGPIIGMKRNSIKCQDGDLPFYKGQTVYLYRQGLINGAIFSEDKQLLYHSPGLNEELFYLLDKSG